MRDALVRGLVQGELDVVAPREVAKAHEPAPCNDRTCAQEIATAVEARYVISTHVVYRDKTYAFSLDAFDGQTGDLVASSSDRCSLCGAAEAKELLSKQASGIRVKLERLAVGPAQFDIATDPQGARVRVDGELVGETPLTVELVPGEHRIELSRDGYASIARTIDAVRGVREQLSEVLEPVVGTDVETPAPPRSGRTLKIAGASALGVGVGSLAAGIAFLVLDGAPRESACSGPDVDAAGNCRQVYTTLPHGAALTAVGIGLLGTGVGLLVAGLRRDARSRGSQRARVQLVGGGVVGWF